MFDSTFNYMHLQICHPGAACGSPQSAVDDWNEEKPRAAGAWTSGFVGSSRTP